jgi:hypothetical protein
MSADENALSPVNFNAAASADKGAPAASGELDPQLARISFQTFKTPRQATASFLAQLPAAPSGVHKLRCEQVTGVVLRQVLHSHARCHEGRHTASRGIGVQDIP